VNTRETTDPKTLSEVLTLLAETTRFDGIPPVAEHVLLHLRHGGDKDDRHIVITDDRDGRELLAGYAHLDLTDQVEGPSAELVIHPDYRGKGFGRALLDHVSDLSGARLRLWAHGDLPSAKHLAESRGFTRIRTVVQMRRTLNSPLPSLARPQSLRTFRVGDDEKAWLELNNRAFKDHPDQGNWSERDLEIRKQENWFDPKGFIIATENTGGDTEKMIGFCWVKIHGGTKHQDHDHDPIGEIYVMGVDPASQGQGVGKEVTLAGLHFMQDQGIFSAMLYVDAANDAALALYSSLGFTEWGRDVLYRKS
jgi:mycothiol synthase